MENATPYSVTSFVTWPARIRSPHGYLLVKAKSVRHPKASFGVHFRTGDAMAPVHDLKEIQTIDQAMTTKYALGKKQFWREACLAVRLQAK